MPLRLLRWAVPVAILLSRRVTTEPVPSTEQALLRPSTTEAHFPSACSALVGAALLEVLQGWVPIAVRSGAVVSPPTVLLQRPLLVFLRPLLRLRVPMDPNYRRPELLLLEAELGRGTGLLLQPEAPGVLPLLRLPSRPRGQHPPEWATGRSAGPLTL
jgi:hypothetical protein